MNYSEIEIIAKKNQQYIGVSKETNQIKHNSSTGSEERSKSKENREKAPDPGVIRHGVQSTLLN